MQRLRGSRVVSRSMALVILLAAGTGLLEYLFHANTIIMKWTMLVAFLIIVGLFGFMPLALTKNQLVNRWLRASYVVLWVFCVSIAALLMGAALIWAITQPALDHMPDASAILLFITWIVFIVGSLVLCGLAVPGSIAKEIKESNERSRAWGLVPGRH
jgi:hypothetical protein